MKKLILVLLGTALFLGGLTLGSLLSAVVKGHFPDNILSRGKRGNNSKKLYEMYQ